MTKLSLLKVCCYIVFLSSVGASGPRLRKYLYNVDQQQQQQQYQEQEKFISEDFEDEEYLRLLQMSFPDPCDDCNACCLLCGGLCPSSCGVIVCTSNIPCPRCGENDRKFQICHMPDGNPDNAQLLCLSGPAAVTHRLDGDTCGEPCPPDVFTLAPLP